MNVVIHHHDLNKSDVEEDKNESYHSTEKIKTDYWKNKFNKDQVNKIKKNLKLDSKNIAINLFQREEYSNEQDNHDFGAFIRQRRTSPIDDIRSKGDQGVDEMDNENIESYPEHSDSSHKPHFKSDFIKKSNEDEGGYSNSSDGENDSEVRHLITIG